MSFLEKICYYLRGDHYRPDELSAKEDELRNLLRDSTSATRDATQALKETQENSRHMIRIADEVLRTLKRMSRR